ncbi:hypothetical protein FB451DRAFT_1180296 [Mycena latifolia]|nr:hypothetical protein FB451DRAFT_1180296 [Mycena latifolia]
MGWAFHTGEGVLPHLGAAPARLAFGVGGDRPHRVADDGADDSAPAHVVIEYVFAAGACTVGQAPRSHAEYRDKGGESHAREHRRALPLRTGHRRTAAMHTHPNAIQKETCTQILVSALHYGGFEGNWGAKKQVAWGPKFSD